MSESRNTFQSFLFWNCIDNKYLKICISSDKRVSILLILELHRQHKRGYYPHGRLYRFNPSYSGIASTTRVFIEFPVSKKWVSILLILELHRQQSPFGPETGSKACFNPSYSGIASTTAVSGVGAACHAEVSILLILELHRQRHRLCLRQHAGQGFNPSYSGIASTTDKGSYTITAVGGFQSFLFWNCIDNIGGHISTAYQFTVSILLILELHRQPIRTVLTTPPFRKVSILLILELHRQLYLYAPAVK